MKGMDARSVAQLSVREDRHRSGWEKLNLAQNWLDDSVKQAGELSRSRLHSKSRLPKRVLDLGKEPWCAPEKDFIRLRCSTFLNHSQYVTLSHRWGSLTPFTTTKKSLRSRRDKIMFKSLPKTFRDAIIVTRALKIRYLWIDALCIVQDDSEDWQEQSAAMGGIYSNALFTIAAHAAMDTDDGFLEKSLSEPQTLRFGVGTEQEYTLRAPADIHIDVERSHLNRRGWVLQERYLSNRILHFAQGQIYWEDTRGFRTEDIAEEALPRNEAPTGNTIETFEEKSTPWVSIKSEDPRRIALVPRTSGNMKKISLPDWEYMVQDYSQCGLTHESDKLLAISGLVKAFKNNMQEQHPHLDATYAAGIWLYRAHRDLLWYGGQEELRPSLSLRAPSWSWAAYDGRIHLLVKNSILFGGDLRSRIRVLEAIPDQRITPNKSTIWLNGAGVLVIKAALHSIHMFEHQTNLHTSPIWKTCYVRENTNDHIHPFTDNWFGIYGNYGPAQSSEIVGYISFDQKVQRPIDRYVHCARITQTGTERDGSIAFLLLVKLGESDNVFARVGMGIISSRYWFKKSEEIIQLR
jgi:hypothetical protein